MGATATPAATNFNATAATLQTNLVAMTGYANKWATAGGAGATGKYIALCAEGLPFQATTMANALTGGASPSATASLLVTPNRPNSPWTTFNGTLDWAGDQSLLGSPSGATKATSALGPAGLSTLLTNTSAASAGSCDFTHTSTMDWSLKQGLVLVGNPHQSPVVYTLYWDSALGFGTAYTTNYTVPPGWHVLDLSTTNYGGTITQQNLAAMKYLRFRLESYNSQSHFDSGTATKMHAAWIARPADQAPEVMIIVDDGFASVRDFLIPAVEQYAPSLLGKITLGVVKSFNNHAGDSGGKMGYDGIKALVDAGAVVCVNHTDLHYDSQCGVNATSGVGNAAVFSYTTGATTNWNVDYGEGNVVSNLAYNTSVRAMQAAHDAVFGAGVCVVRSQDYGNGTLAVGSGLRVDFNGTVTAPVITGNANVTGGLGYLTADVLADLQSNEAFMSTWGLITKGSSKIIVRPFGSNGYQTRQAMVQFGAQMSFQAGATASATYRIDPGYMAYANPYLLPRVDGVAHATAMRQIADVALRGGGLAIMLHDFTSGASSGLAKNYDETIQMLKLLELMNGKSIRVTTPMDFRDRVFAATSKTAFTYLDLGG
jgi:hypothetical protein